MKLVKSYLNKPDPKSFLGRAQRPVIVILLVGLLHGLIYYFLIPPWWHYDEPGQFEYAWLAANRPAWPQPGDYDEAMRREMARSMQRYGWYSFRNYTPNFSGSEPIWIGVSQTGGQPAYYFILSLALRLTRDADITLQYDIARFISLLLYLLIIVIIWEAMGEIVPTGHPLQWNVTAFVALLPAFTDTMVSVNDDVGAVLASCIFLWASLRCIMRGISLTRLLSLGLALALCYLTKTTAWYAFLTIPFVLIFSLLRGRFTRWIWVTTAAMLLIVPSMILVPGYPASWYKDSTRCPLARVQTKEAPFGKYAFAVEASSGKSPQGAGQFLGPQAIKPLRGKPVTLGVWLWADGPIQAHLPLLRFVTSGLGFVDRPLGTLDLDVKPVFDQAVIDVPNDAIRAILFLPYPAQPPTSIRIYFDGLVLAPGKHSSTPPQLTGAQAIEDNWDGQDFRNLIRNGSAEEDSLSLRPWVDKITSRLPYGYNNPSFIFSSLQDWQGTRSYYLGSLSTLFRTFWASLLGDKLHLSGGYPNEFLILLTFLGLLGACRLFWRKRKELRGDILYILGMTLAITWGISALRGSTSLLESSPLFPWARYAYPAILPTALLLCAGWLEWISWLKEKLHFTDAASNAIFLGGMLGLSAFAIIKVFQFFHGSTWENWGNLAMLLLLQYLAFQLISKGRARLNR